MKISANGVIAATFLSLALAGCQSERFSQVDTRGPAPLAPAPAGVVTSSQLPAPSQPGSMAVTDASQFPVAPGADPMADQQQMAALEQGGAEISTGSVAGVWNASVSGQSCRIATPQTRFGQGFRAGPLRCPTPLDGVRSWNVTGNQLALYDGNGDVLARLYSSTSERFDGQTSNGVPVSLSR